MKLAFLALATVLLAAACGQDTTLVSSPASPSPTSSSPWGNPTPGSTPYKIAYVGPDNCYGNADHSFFRIDDPDDPQGESDAWECLWYCAIDIPSGINTPQEFEEIWDFDGGTPEEYGVDSILANYAWSSQYPKPVGACNSDPNPAP